jgi:hypothetical protein
VRVQTPFTRTSDGKSAVIGEPLVKYRFPLTRLSWLSCDGPAANLSNSDARYDSNGTASKILDSFGLTWDSTNHWWTYDHGKGNGIYTLNELAALSPPREPDFIELLQAAINVGSLGKSLCETFTMASARLTENNYSASKSSELIPAMPEYQVLQIAACMIDQADTDSFPTEIQMKSPASGSMVAVYGVERLPMIDRVNIQYATRPPSGTGDQGGFGLYLVPEVWNPHENSMAVPSGPVPTQFRVTLNCPNKQTDYSFQFNGSNPYPLPVTNNWTFAYTDPAGKWSGTPNTTGPGYTSYTFDTSYPGYPFTTPTGIYENAKVPPTPKSGSTWEIAGLPLIKFDPWYSYFTPPNGAVSNNNTSGITPATSTLALADAATRKTGDNQRGTINTIATVGDIPNVNAQFDSSGSGMEITLECQDSSGVWRVISDYSHLWNHASAGILSNKTVGGIDMTTMDPRSDRFPPTRNYLQLDTPYTPAPLSQTFRPDYNANGNTSWRWTKNSETPAAPGWTNNATNYGYYCYYLGLVSQNTVTPKYSNISGANINVNTSYADPDGVVRGGDAMYATTANQDMLSTSASPNPARPIILNRPFRSVGELGYTFRGAPFKTVDFFSNKVNSSPSSPNSGTDSADTALLDVFCLAEPPIDSDGVSAGAVNLNTRNKLVIESLLSAGNSGALLDESPGGSASYISATDQDSIASKFVAATTASPATNLSDLVSRVIQGQALPSGTDADYKRRREAPIRALSAGTTTRVWNLLFDIIVQSGMPTTAATQLDRFAVNGEKRIWVHVAIDRLTGRVLDSQIETIVE